MKGKVVILVFCATTLFSHETQNISNNNVVKVKEYTFALKVDENQEEIIREIIVTMARFNPIKLGFRRKYLSALGRKLKGLGPLHFLGYVGSNKDLRRALKKISRSSLKWNGFVDGMSKGLNRAHEKKTLYRDLPGFASLIEVDEKLLLKHANKKNWSAFIEEVAVGPQEVK